MDSTYISQRITALRIKKNIAEHKMSLELGHSRSYISSISSERALPSITEFLAICDYLNVSPRDFFEEENPNPALIKDIANRLKKLSDKDLALIVNIIDRLEL